MHFLCLDKMFKSARYYFRKKGTEKKEPKRRCSYIGTAKELLDAMDTLIELPERMMDKPFLLAVDSIHKIEGRGIVVTGTVEQGTCKIGDDIEVLGFKVNYL